MRNSRTAADRAKLLLLETATAISMAIAPEEQLGANAPPEMLCFRGQTLAIVRDFLEVSCQVGRVCSLLGREFFRARVSHHAIPSFEEQALFVRDIELCFACLNDQHAAAVALAGVYDLSLDEVAAMLACSKTMAHHWFNEGLDALSEIFLERGILRFDRPDRHQQQAMDHGLPLEDVGSARKPPVSVQVLPVRCVAQRATQVGAGHDLQLA